VAVDDFQPPELNINRQSNWDAVVTWQNNWDAVVNRQSNWGAVVERRPVAGLPI